MRITNPVRSMFTHQTYAIDPILIHSQEHSNKQTDTVEHTTKGREYIQFLNKHQ